MQDAVGSGAGTETAREIGRGSGASRGQVRARSRSGSAARELRLLDRAAVDGRTGVGRALSAWRADLVADLGGDPSTAQLAVIDLAVKTKLLLDSIDAWLLTQPSLVNKRRRTLLPVVRERQSLADALARYLGQLGLERRVKPIPDLQAYLDAKQERR